MVHNELLTHRTLWKTDSEQFETWLDASRNSSSNRALAPTKVLDQVVHMPYIPLFYQPTRGMRSDKPLDPEEQEAAEWVWLRARDDAVRSFQELGGHKQHRNRLLAPWQYITTVVTANEQWWVHFFNLRDHPDAQPDLAIVAGLAHDEYSRSRPDVLDFDDYHLPYVTFDEVVNYGERDLTERRDPNWTTKRLSVARCARSSYLRQGELLEVEEDLELFERLTKSTPPHVSPLDHVATPIDPYVRSGNLIGWRPFRFESEN
jgi:hypothetical protein